MAADVGTVGVTGAALLAAAAAAVLLLRADDGRLHSALPPPAYGDRAGRGPSPARPRGAGPAGRAPGPARRGPSPTTGRVRPQRRWPASNLACGLAGVGALALLPLPVGPVVGLAVAVTGPRLLARLEPGEARTRREQLARDLPLLLDLLSACLAGGASLTAASAAVGQAVDGPAGERLTSVGAALRVGSPPSDAWANLAGPDVAARDDDPLGPAARALARAADGGAPVAATIARLAADARADGRSRAEQAARRVGVLSVAPLGLCFLPAFVLLGIVPLVLSLAGPLLAGA